MVANAAIGGVALHMSGNAVTAKVTRKVGANLGAAVMYLATEMGDGALTRPLI